MVKRVDCSSLTLFGIFGLLVASCSGSEATQQLDGVGGAAAEAADTGGALDPAAALGGNTALGGATSNGGMASGGGPDSSGGITALAAGGTTGVSLGGALTTGGASTSAGGSATTTGGFFGTGGATAAGGATMASGGLFSAGGADLSGLGGADLSGLGGQDSGGAAGTSSAGSTSSGGNTSSAGSTSSGGTSSELPLFSFFATSWESLQARSGPNGFGGDLRYGQPDGLSGADKICAELAEASMPGSSAKQWRAFLSVAIGSEGIQIDAIDRVGAGPWYDRLGRVLALSPSDLLNTRPLGADPSIVNDLPNEFGVPNHDPDGTGEVDNHHFLTGSDQNGTLYAATATCSDWTSTTAEGRPRAGFSWPAGGRAHWISGQDEGGCLAGVQFVDSGGSNPSVGTVGSGGGYGGFYCFALTP